MWRAALVVGFTLALASAAHGEPWHRGRHGTNRIVHLSIAVVGGVAYPATAGIEADLASSTCTWCSPTWLDVHARNALSWNEGPRAYTFSNVSAYVLTPTIAFGLILVQTPPSWADVIDNVVPIAESMVVTQWVVRAVKLSVARQRPYAHFDMPAGTEEDNLSFPSGHTARAFSLAVAAGAVARARGYSTEPLVWGTGLTLGVATAYFRVAADKHYLTDVLTGAAIGTTAGLTVPLLMKREVEVVPTPSGLALAGTW